MKIYLDNCCLQRPLDDKSQIRVQLEAEAILAVLTFCENQEIQLVSSAILEFEQRRNPHPQRQAYVEEILAKAAIFVELTNKITVRGKELEKNGFKGADALHLACAESEQVDYFCSCDERLLRRAKTLKVVHVKVVSPLELVEEIIE
jgi:predicted nucleic acid-binding protein